MNRIPWSVLLMMVNDQGRMKDNKASSGDEEEDIIVDEKEELEFLGLA